MDSHFIHLIILNAGILLLLAVAGGKFVSLFRAPKVTGYLLVGILLGPSVLGYFFPIFKGYILSSEIKNVYTIITDIGLGLIIFNVGGEFKFSHLLKLGRSALWVSFYEIVFTFLLVFGFSFLGFLLFADDIVLGEGFSYSILLGVVGIATAPAATLLVLREYESKGPITDYLFVLIGLNNIVCIVLFKVFFSLFLDDRAHFIDPFVEILLSIFIGILVGLLVSFVEKWLDKSGEVLILVMGGITLNIGIVSLFQNILPSLFPSVFVSIHISNLLANLFMGITLINASTKGDSAFNIIRGAELPIYVLFFVLAGANLHFEELMSAGILFVLYVLGRGLGKYFGSYFAVRRLGLFNKFGYKLGMALFPQAGVAIGLASLLLASDFAMSGMLASIILSGVIVFEFGGPFFTRFAIVRGGEVKAISVSRRAWAENKRRYSKVLVKLKQSLGFTEVLDSVVLSCKDIMRSSVESIIDSASFDEVLKFASKCEYDNFTVVDKDGHFIGLISYSEIRDILLEPEFAGLIIAKDMIKGAVAVAYPGNSVEELIDIFHSLKGSLEYLPVLDDHEPAHLIGMVTQKDTIKVYKAKR